MIIDDAGMGMSKYKIISSFLQKFYQNRNKPIKILEAGCGRKWLIDLGSIKFKITGVDNDKKAIEIRQKNVGNIEKYIIGDLRTVGFKKEEFDLIYCCEVIEHIRGAKEVIDNFFEWLIPGGLLVLVFPDRDTAIGTITRITPHWFHVAFIKHIFKNPNAGKPGFAPYPTYYDKIVSRHGFCKYIRERNYKIFLEYRGPAFDKYLQQKLNRYAIFILKVVFHIIQYFSSGRISAEHGGLIYVIQKTK